MAEADDTANAPFEVVRLNFTTNLAIAFALFLLGASAVLDYPADSELHVVLDTSVALAGALIALLLLDISRRSDQSLPLFLAISFALMAIAEMVHLSAALGWLHYGADVALSDARWRSGSWGPAAILLPVAVGASLALKGRPRTLAWPLAGALALLGAALVALFLSIPRYVEPGLLGITRPSLILVPLLWIGVGFGYWRRRRESEIAWAVATTAIILALANAVMLYSRSPSDFAAMVAHLGKFIGDALLLFNLTQIGAADTARRKLAERELTALNRDLDARVAERTAAQRRSQDLIEAIVANSPAVIYVRDLAGRYLMINQRYADIFHVDREAMIGKTDYDIFPKATADAFRAMDERVAAADRPLTEEETAPHDDGPHTYISVKSQLRDDSGQAYALVSISTDITEGRRAEEALLASEMRHRLLVEAALDAVISMDGTGIITGWNPQAEEIFGWTDAEVLGRPVDEIVMPERYRDAHRGGLARYHATGEAPVLNRRIELEGLHRSGREFPVELSIVPIRMGETVTFSAFVRDITDRKVADAKLQTQLDRLHLLEHITRAVGQRQDLNSIFQVVVRTLEERLPADFVCICRYDPDRPVLTVGQVGAGSAQLGEELGLVERAEVMIDGNGLSRCVGGELVYEPDIAAVDFPFPQRLAGHGLRALVVTPLAVREETFGLIVVARLAEASFSSTDCEFLKQLGEHVALAAHQMRLHDSLQQAYDDLRLTQQSVLQQERLRAIGQMASGIAHDINNAISPVAVYTQSLLEQTPGLAPELRDYLQIVDRVVKDIAATVGRMRDFYRRDESEAERALLNLNDLVPQVVELTRARWSDMPQQRGVVIKLVTALGENLPLVAGDAAALREAMTNLVFNAVDALPDGGTITIRTSLIPGGDGADKVSLEVADDGAGMDEATRDRCLEPFFTTKGERGTGLGMATVYGTVQRHDATLDIDSAPGAGTRVRLAFPIAAAHNAPATRDEAPDEIRPLRLLLVDDDPAVLKSTETVLRRYGHQIVAADGGQAGIDALRAAKQADAAFDVVITDLGMPYVDGNKVARAAKELFPATAVVQLTGWGKRMVTGDEVPAFIDFVLPKPLDLGDLRNIFAQVVRGDPAERDPPSGV